MASDKANATTFKAGHKSKGGRPSGAPNKDTETVKQTCARLGVNVAEAMVLTYLNPTTSVERKDAMLFGLAKFLYAQPREVQLSGNLAVETRLEEKLNLLREKAKATLLERKGR